MSKISIRHIRGPRGEMTVPGDKSISHRAALIGAISEGDTYVRGFLKSDSCMATLRCLHMLGIETEVRRGEARKYFYNAEKDEPILIVHGRGLRGLSDPGDMLDARSSGTTARLLSGILAGQDFISRITGDESLQARPMGRIIRPLGYMGIMCATEDNCERLPMTIFGGSPHAIRYNSPVASAQVKSCVLLAGLYADEPTFYTEPALSRNHTEKMLGAFGANLKIKKRAPGEPVTTILYPGTKLMGQKVTVPGDISSAAYFLAAGLLVPGSDLTITNVGINETRDGIIRVIRAMGGNLSVDNIRMEGGEAVADLRVRASSLHGTTIGGSVVPTLIDEIPVIAVMAACADGVTVIRDIGELKYKETNRLREICRNLRAMGISVNDTDDEMEIEGGRLRGAVIDPKGDHRLAMAFSIAGLVSEGTVTIRDEKCVDISYPGFFEDLYRFE